MVVVLVAAGVLVWAGATLLLDAWTGRRRDLAGRLLPYVRTVGDEAEEWLRERRAR